MDEIKPSTEAFTSRSLYLNHLVTSRHLAPSGVERAGGERLGTRLDEILCKVAVRMKVFEQ